MVFGNYIYSQSKIATILSTMIEMPLGGLVALFILKSRRNSFYLKSIYQVIFDGMTEKKPIDIAKYLPESSIHKDHRMTATIVFIDIASYSLLNRKIKDDVLNEAIIDMYESINKQAKELGGRIDKSLGDGLLLYFKNASSAVSAACKIQRSSLIRGLKQRMIMPLRIGINTANVLSTNLGDSTRFDVTLMGEGVVIAKRLEASCHSHKILIGASTIEAMGDDAKSLQKDPCLIRMKHSTNLTTAWHVNPFEHSPELLIQADAFFWETLDKTIKKQRYNVNSGVIYLDSDIGTLELKNYSENGFGVISPTLLGRSHMLKLEIKGPKSLESILHDKFLDTIETEVAWSRKSSDGTYKMGLKILGRNERECAYISSALSQYATQEKSA